LRSFLLRFLRLRHALDDGHPVGRDLAGEGEAEFDRLRAAREQQSESAQASAEGLQVLRDIEMQAETTRNATRDDTK